MNDASGVDVGAWQQVVRELQRPEATDQVYVQRLTQLLGQITAARQAVLFAPGADVEVQMPVYVWPIAEGVTAPVIAQRERVGEVAASVIGMNEPRLVASDEQGVVIAVPLPKRYGASGAPVAGGGVVTLLLDGANAESLRTLMVLTQLITGYLGQQVLSRMLRDRESRAEALELGTALLASVNEAKRFRAAALRIVNDLCRTLGADRVSFGWARGRAGIRGNQKEAPALRVVAVSDTEHVDHKQESVQRIEAAMEEACDQQQAVMAPLPDDTNDDALGAVISHVHRELARVSGSSTVCTVPMRIGEMTYGALTVEKNELSMTSVGALQAVADLIAPVMRLRRVEDRALAVGAVDSALRTGAWAVGPRQTGWKLAGIAVAAGFVALATITAPVPVRGESHFEVTGRRIVSAPFEGVVRMVPGGITLGARVAQGDVLVQLEDAELKLSALDVQGELREAEAKASAALGAQDLAGFDQATAEAAQARARAALLHERIAAATVRAPIAGVVLAGEIQDRAGGTVSLGEPLLEVAPLDGMRVIALVDDRDIRFLEEGMTGRVARTSNPTESLAIEVTRIVPLAEAKDGVNTFRVMARLLEGESERGLLRPGMEGKATFDGPRRSLMWIGTRRVRDAVRLWLWW